MTMDIIPGNHDTYFKNTNDLNSSERAVGSLYERNPYYYEAYRDELWRS